MKVTGFRTKKSAKAYQEEHGGKILWEEWSPTYRTFTKIGKAYLKAMKGAGIPLEEWSRSGNYAYIVVEEDK